ncbi:molybdenum cofactor guanylyltransferase [Robertmurraya sp. P23]|uniref:molybdenum cofactor guanylyltransferase n=1 Tax=Robertmurraya sp. P23 TaxID=3436931 RepID=UPI003D97115D
MSLSRTGIILAGGQSSRMGQNKALMMIDGVPVIERIANELEKISDELLIVTNTFHTYEYLNIPMVEDEQKGKGPIAGIQAGLKASRSEKNLIVACDMPFISLSLGEFLLEELEGYQAAIPKLDGRIHPLFGAYRKDALQAVSQSLERNELRIMCLLQNLHVRYISEDILRRKGIVVKDTAVFNMNDQIEYEKALKLDCDGNSFCEKSEGI